MIEVKENSKLQFHWNVSPYDFSEEKSKELVSKISKKYNISKEQVRVIPNFIMLNEKGENINLTNDIIMNIQNPQFQLSLFNEYLTVNQIKDYDFEFIKKIDAEINASINYDLYDKYRRYSIKWLKWNNFLSYGKENFIDFTQLKNLVLLNGNPSNQSGKTTFAIDLLHFLLFGKTEKAGTQDKIFNKWLKEETEVVVEGCLCIDGNDYVIKRTLSRPQLKNRTSKSKTTQKVEYYQIIGGNVESLEEYVDKQQEENSIKTNKVIKETIGNESDFDLMICATSSNLDDLIEKKDTERGKLLSRWIGLLPIEKKDELAREKYNSEIKPYLISNKYDVETLLQSKEAFNLTKNDYQQQINNYIDINKKVDDEILKLDESIKILLLAKQTIDESVLKLDITTLQNKINTLTNKGLELKEVISNLQNEISNINIGEFSEDEYENLYKVNIELNKSIVEIKTRYKFLQEQTNNLQKSEYCPTCGKKLDNVDNSKKIQENIDELNRLKNEGIEINNELQEIVNKMNSMKESRDLFNKKSQLTMKCSASQVQIEQLRNELREAKQLESEYNKNKEAIDKNNTIDLNIRNYEVTLNGYRNTKEQNIRYINKLENDITNLDKNIKDIDDTILKIQEEEKVIRNWKIYLDMVGKNGITKMVLRKSLPIINAQINTWLQDVCDFNVEISITEKNEVMFYLIKDGVISDLNSGSGFEKTAAALALRFTLAKNSVIPKLSYCVLDEITGRVADENLDKIKNLLDKVIQDYDFILLVTHNQYFKSVCEQCITVTKEDNVSKLVTIESK